MIPKEALSSSYRKVIPHDFENRGPSHKPKYAPSVELKHLGKISVTLFPNGHKIGSSELTQTTLILKESFGTLKRALKVIPLAKAPLTPTFETHFGGGRTYGGGTSKESLRRAKKKISQLTQK